MNERNPQTGVSTLDPDITGIHYTKEETRVHNKRMAPTGHIFLVVRSKGKGFKCSNHMAVPFGLTADQKQGLYETMYAQLQTKYGI